MAMGGADVLDRAAVPGAPIRSVDTVVLGTTRAAHLGGNFGAAHGHLPHAATRVTIGRHGDAGAGG
jgi:hypothetical protein